MRRNGVVKKGEQSKNFVRSRRWSGSDILVSASEICYTRTSCNNRRYATQTRAAQVHKMAVAPAQRPGRLSDWRQDHGVRAGLGCWFKARNNSNFKTEKQWKPPPVMHYCKIETEPGSFAFSLGAYNRRRVLLQTRTYTVGYWLQFLWINNRWSCPNVLCNKSAKQRILYPTLLVTANLIFVLNLLCQRMRGDWGPDLSVIF